MNSNVGKFAIFLPTFILNIEFPHPNILHIQCICLSKLTKEYLFTVSIY